MTAFTFNGTTVVAPQVLVRSVLGASRALQLLPNGTIAMFGAADGGEGGGTVYTFNDIPSMKRLLRGGDLYNALYAAAILGGASNIIAVVAGPKTSASSEIVCTSGAADFVSGDQGNWTNSIGYTIVAGTLPNTFAITFTYPDQNGNTITVGGLTSSLDNLADLNALQAALLNNSLLTPAVTTGLPAIVILNITANGVPSDTVGVEFLTGGTLDGSYSLSLSDVEEAIDEAVDISFDIGHLVKCYDYQMHQYADRVAATQQAVYGNLRRFIHQAPLTGVSKNQSKAQNSEAVANSLIAAAAHLQSMRSSVQVQQVNAYDPGTGTTAWIDAAPVTCGHAAYVGATDAWGPASPLTHVPISTVLDVDYVALAKTGDLDRAILGGGWHLERFGTQPTLGSVRHTQSVTTAPNDPNTGQPWSYGEFSIVRVSDAVLANVKGAVEAAVPRAVGGGNTPKTMAAIVSLIVGVLELAIDSQWIISYDKSSISIQTASQTGDADTVNYSMVPTPPLNHLGVTQTLLPFTATLTAGGTVNAGSS